jgi:hypothetical protein
MVERTVNDTKLDLTKRLEKATEECRCAIREAHEVIRDLKALRTEMVDLVQHGLDDAREVYKDEIAQQVKNLGIATKDSMERSVKEITKRFRAMEAQMLEPIAGGMTAEEMVMASRIVQKHAKVGVSIGGEIPEALAPIVQNRPNPMLAPNVELEIVQAKDRRKIVSRKDTR